MSELTGSDGFLVEPTARTADEVRRRHEANRNAWNEAATRYAKEIGASRDFLAAGHRNVHPIERRNLERYGPLSAWRPTAIRRRCPPSAHQENRRQGRRRYPPVPGVAGERA